MPDNHQLFQHVRTFQVYQSWEEIPEAERRFVVPTTQELIDDRYLETFTMMQGPLGLLVGDDDID